MALAVAAGDRGWRSVRSSRLDRVGFAAEAFRRRGCSRADARAVAQRRRGGVARVVVFGGGGGGGGAQVAADTAGERAMDVEAGRVNECS